ncbi:MAG: hypothetical protein H0T75_09685 [Rhizobiales bacterium]|nr:hypothetical protein [Hyphomicrobiales bacterium]
MNATNRIVGRVAALGDRFGVAIIILLRLDVGPDILGRHQPHLVSLGNQKAPEVMGSAARLHRDHSRRIRRRSRTRPAASKPTTLQLFLPRSTPRI